MISDVVVDGKAQIHLGNREIKPRAIASAKGNGAIRVEHFGGAIVLIAEA